MPETVIVADEVEGTYVDSNGEGHHRRGKVKNHRSQSGAQGEGGKKMKSPKRKVIRVEYEETQDDVREPKSTEFRTECDECSAKAVVSM